MIGMCHQPSNNFKKNDILVIAEKENQMSLLEGGEKGMSSLKGDV